MEIFACPYCHNVLSYGWPCIHELQLFLLELGRWRCSNCKTEFISDHKIISIEGIEALVKQSSKDLN
jgi:hypothetical protein